MSTDLTFLKNEKNTFFKKNGLEEMISIVIETNLDCIVYGLYGLTEEEIEIVEGSVG